MGRIYPHQLQGLPEVTVENQLCRGRPHGAGLNFSGSLVPGESALSVCCLWRWLAGALTWSEAVHRVCWPRSATTCVLPGPPSMRYKVICRWLLLVLGLEVPRRDQTVNPSQMLLVLGLGPLARGTGYMEARCYLFERFLGKSEA